MLRSSALHSSSHDSVRSITTSSSSIHNSNPAVRNTSGPIKLASDFQPLASARDLELREKIGAAITTSRLQFGRLGLFGREQQVAKLKECLSHVVKRESSLPRKELVLIRGESGSGKSALADSLRDPVKAAGGVYCVGKFDIHQRDEPLAGITTTCKQLCQHVLEIKDQHKFQTVQKQFLEQLGTEAIQLLIHVGLDLPSVLKDKQLKQSTHTLPVQNAQLTAAFQGFIQVISNVIGPLVMIYDDMQWADDPSIRIIQSLVTLSDSSLLVVACFRSNQMMGESLLFRAIKDLKEEALLHEDTIGVTEMETDNLKHKDIVQLMSNLLSKESVDVQELARICLIRTNGNAYFVKAFLSMLVDEGLLTFNVGKFVWDWDNSIISSNTSVSQNLVELVHSRLTRISREVLELLQVAACLGNNFERRTLFLAWAMSLGYSSEYGVDESFDKILHQTILDSFLVSDDIRHNIEKSPDPILSSEENACMTLRFAHDNIQGSVLSLLTEEQKCKLQFKVGSVLLKWLPSPKSNSMIFVIATLVNARQGRNHDPSLAELNLKAARKAQDLTAFSSVVYFVTNGLSYLDQDKMWRDHLQLSIDLNTLGAQAEQKLGNYESALVYCQAVIQQEAATSLQKCGAYKVEMDVIHISQHSSLSLDSELSVLAELGCEFPSSKPARKKLAKKYMMETKEKYMPSIAHIGKMAMMTDLQILETVQLLERAGTTAYVLADMDLYILIRCRFVRLIWANGLTNDSGAAYASFANILMNVYGDIPAAVKIAELSLVVQNVLPSKYYQARTMMSANLFVLCWVHPLRSQMKELLSAYQFGIRSGNTFSAFQSLVFFLYCELVSGTNLGAVDQDCVSFISQMKRSHIGHAITLCVPMAQLVHNLMGKSSNTIELSGDWIADEKKFLENDTRIVTGWFPRFKCWACLYFGAYEAGAKLVQRLGGLKYLQDNFPGDALGLDILSFGVCCYAAARTTGSSAYKRIANEMRAESQRLVDHGCVSLIHVLCLLNAEYYASSGKVSNAKQAFADAVVKSVRSGFPQNGALAHKRFADFLLSVNDSSDAAFHVQEAIKYYDEWGAVQVVQRLQASFVSLLSEHPSSDCMMP